MNHSLGSLSRGPRLTDIEIVTAFNSWRHMLHPSILSMNKEVMFPDWARSLLNLVWLNQINWLQLNYIKYKMVICFHSILGDVNNQPLYCYNLFSLISQYFTDAFLTRRRNLESSWRKSFTCSNATGGLEEEPPVAAAVATGCIPPLQKTVACSTSQKYFSASYIVFLRLYSSIQVNLQDNKPITFRVVNVRIVSIKVLRHL